MISEKEKFEVELITKMQEYISKFEATPRELNTLCSNVILGILDELEEKEAFLTSALYESFNTHDNFPKMDKYNIISLAPSFASVFKRGVPTTHSPHQIKNYEIFKKSFNGLDESTKIFLIEKYPVLQKIKE